MKLENIKKLTGEEKFSKEYKLAAELFNKLSTDKDFSDFLTLKAYRIHFIKI